MRRAFGVANLVWLVAVLSACGSERREQVAAAPAETGSTAIAAASLPPIFAHCRSCHSVRPGENGIGPTLHGIYGRRAASQDFAYSPALKASGLTWDEPTLDEWLKGPMKLVPGTRMVMGIPDSRQRAAVIEYLRTLE